MANFIVVRPRDDTSARQASDWCDALVSELSQNGHTLVEDVDDTSPPKVSQILAALARNGLLVCYFGHGNNDNWLTSGNVTVDKSNVSAAAGKAIVSIACKTGRNLGSDALTAGVRAWLGFTVRVPVLAPHKNRDPIGNTMVDALAVLGTGGTMQDAHDAIERGFGGLADDYDTGPLSGQHNSVTGYLASIVLRDHVSLDGTGSFLPL